jgi:hypothetical protein
MEDKKVIPPTDEQVKECAEFWKEALNKQPGIMGAMRMYADKDFMTGATWMRDLLMGNKK